MHSSQLFSLSVQLWYKCYTGSRVVAILSQAVPPSPLSSGPVRQLVSHFKTSLIHLYLLVDLSLTSYCESIDVIIVVIILI